MRGFRQEVYGFALIVGEVRILTEAPFPSASPALESRLLGLEMKDGRVDALSLAEGSKRELEDLPIDGLQLAQKNTDIADPFSTALCKLSDNSRYDGIRQGPFVHGKRS